MSSSETKSIRIPPGGTGTETNNNWVNATTSFSNFENYLNAAKTTKNDKDFTYQINIPSNFLPKKHQLLYGFDSDSTALIATIKYEKNEKILKVEQPNSSGAFTGSKLIDSAIRDFFSPKYTPKQNYRSSPFSVMGPTPSSGVNTANLFKKGVNRYIASRVLSNFNNDIDQSLLFINDGKIDSSFERPNINSIIPFEENPLVYLVFEIVDCIFELQDHCFICRAPIPPVIKPSTCSDRSCVNAASIQPCLDVVHEIRRDKMVADLLVSFFVTAIGTNRLIPAPPPLSRREIESLSFEKTTWKQSEDNKLRSGGSADDLNHDPKKLEMLVGKFSSIDETLSKFGSSKALKEELGVEGFNLLLWILQSNRAQFFCLRDDLQIKELHNNDGSMPLQFLTLVSSPEQEVIFQALKAKYGSFYMWHGSPLVNWHSIIRNGLFDTSKRRMVDHASACGAGIYLAKDSGYSLGYARQGENKWSKTSLGKNLSVIALCEVIKLPFSDGDQEYNVDIKN